MPGVASTFETEAGEVRRLEVVNGALGRHRWSPEAKARIVAESLAPGVVVSEVARRHDLLPQQLFAWRHPAKQGRIALPAAALSFVPVVAANMPSPSPSSHEVPATVAGGATGAIEVEIGGAVVRVPLEVDAKQLAKVLRAVKSLA